MIRRFHATPTVAVHIAYCGSELNPSAPDGQAYFSLQLFLSILSGKTCRPSFDVDPAEACDGCCAALGPVAPDWRPSQAIPEDFYAAAGGAP